ncbi:uncharacterized protein EV420DRAFT_1567546 [Desarmillaria tabescens]|uniref:Protein SQS1 n=1 Tax=Armillaria tabescens TaxID=1929756 RepID=A0AA39JT63_ARMTA|nr:uncharacterized protein EV420DRAFT_1567546 [Desarmillaria tabescens]KAK0448358.1 hypothetical protein EV420DRAFT_1567546 [Desarmillaria tabescens]
MSGGYHTPQGQGRRGIGSPPSNYNSYSAPSPGYYSPRGRGRGGRGARSRGGSNGPLSKLLYEDRPYLRPIKFVPSVNTRILFQEQEEILKPVVEDVGDEEESHVPTAERVARVFSGVSKPTAHRDDSVDDVECLEEIDFNDLSAFQQKVDMEARSTTQLNRAQQVDVEEKFTGAFFDTTALKEVATSIPKSHASQDDVIQDNTAESAPVGMISSITVHTTTEAVVTLETPTLEEPDPEGQPASAESTSTPTEVQPGPPSMDDDIVVLALTKKVHASPPLQAADDRESVNTQDEEPPLFFVDTTPAPTPIIASTSTSLVVPLGAATPEEDDVIVYEGPLPRSGVATPVSSKPKTFALPSLSFSPSPRKLARRPHPAHSKTKSKLKERRQAAWVRQHRESESFAALGANVADAQLYEDKDPRHDERRRGDSDVDWGDDTDNEVDEVANGVDGMDLDPEIDWDVEAMKRFVGGLHENSKTIDDIDDEERMREEDEEDSDSQSEDDDDEDEESVRRAIEEGEARMLGDSDADEEDVSPDFSFQTRLQQMREFSRSKQAENRGQGDNDGDSSDDEDVFFRNKTWAEKDDDFIAHIRGILDEAESVPTGVEHQKKKQVFNAIHNGNSDELEWMTQAKRKKDKYKDLPPELQEQWEKDRQKKAEYKREREASRLIQAADPLAVKKGGKKGQKAMLAATRLDPTITVVPNRIIDMTTLVQQIRRFIADIDGTQTMSLPPTDKATRKKVHELALAFNLKSLSKGKGDARYTTLTKTTRTGTKIDEAKVSRIARRGGDFGNEFVNKKGKGKGKLMPRHKDGDEVGKEAPRIGESNIGFRMLASMGWSEGDHIGISGGLKDPVTAVIKTTKLGLGATK